MSADILTKGQTGGEPGIGEEFTRKIAARNRKDRFVQTAPVVVLIGLFVLFTISNPVFLSPENILNILGQMPVPLCLSLGLTFVVLIGSIDLSVDGVMGLTGSVVSLLVLNNKTMLSLGLLGVVIAVAIGGLCGLITGLICVRARVPSFMVTFGMSGIATGVATAVYKAVPPTIEDTWFRGLALNSFLGLPYIAWIALGLFAVAYVIQEYTTFGRYLFAIGDNEQIPRNSGVKVNWIKISAFVWSGACIGLAGVLGAARLGMGTILIGKGNLFPAMTGVVLGGTALSGGKGGVVNTLMGVLIVTTLQNGLVLMGVSSEVQDGIQGVIIVAAVALSAAHGRKVVTK